LQIDADGRQFGLKKGAQVPLVARAIALCGNRTRLTEEEAQPIVIIECST
jgi:hypothetical protein